MGIRTWWRNRKQTATTETAAEEVPAGQGFFTSDVASTRNVKRPDRTAYLHSLVPQQPVVEGVAMDDGEGTVDNTSMLKNRMADCGIPDAQLYWYGSQGFIGYQLCSIIAQHWLVDKACLMPGRDAIRQGYDIRIKGGDDDASIIEAMRDADERHGINRTMREYIQMGRIFGVRYALFKVESTDPEYYEKPFNLDGVTPNSYRGIAQIDPIWVTPLLNSGSLLNPDSLHYYDPDFYLIGGRKYHRSHLAIYIPFPVTDILKPAYQWGGASVPQRIYERVYAAERTANEAPQLTMTKRLTVLKLQMGQFMANLQEGIANIMEWVGLRDNYGIKMVDKDNEDITQFDTSLTDVDTTIMTQYQLVAAIAEVPGTKLLGTQPKGFNATGEYEEACYRETLESIQTNDLTPLLQRHHQLVMRSEVAPRLAIKPVGTAVSWSPLDSPTAEEWATINKTKAETDQIYVSMQAIDAQDVRAKITADKDGDYHDLPEIVAEEPEQVAALDSGLFNPDNGTFGGARLVTNQTYLDPEKVREKMMNRDFEVRVSPEFTDAKGTTYRVILDGHHSLNGALMAGETPIFVERDYTGSNYRNAITNGVGFDGKA